jgi:WD40 repeat protein
MRRALLLLLAPLLLGGGLHARPPAAFQPNAAAAPRLVLQSGAAWVTGVAFSHDGRRVVSVQEAQVGSYDLIRTWDLASSSELVRMLRSTAVPGYMDVGFSFDDQLLITPDADNVVLWDSHTGQATTRLRAPGSAGLTQIAIAPGSQVVGGVGYQGCVMWQRDAPTNPEKPFYIPECTSLFFTPGFQLFTTFGRDVKIVDLSNGKAERRVQAPHWIMKEAFSLDGGVVAVVCEIDADGKQTASDRVKAEQRRHVLVYRTDTGQLIRDVDTGDEIVSVAMSGDGKSFAVGGHDAVRIWTGNWNTPVRVPVTTDPNFGVKALAFSPDGRRLAVGIYDLISIVDVGSGREASALMGTTGTMTALAVTTDGSIVAGSNGGNAFIWDTTTGRRLPRRPIHQTATTAAAFTSMAVSTRGTQVLSGGSDGVARLWDLAKGTTVTTFGKPGQIAMYKAERSRDQQWVVTRSNTVQRWSSSGKLAGDVNSPSSCVSDFAVSPATDEFATLSCYPGPLEFTKDARGINMPTRKFGPATLQTRRVSTGQVVKQITLDNSTPGALAYTPSGKHVAVFGDGIQVYDATTLERAFQVPAADTFDESQLASVPAFSQNGERIAIVKQVAGQMTPQILLLDTRAAPWRVAGRVESPSQVVALALSPDGRFLVTSGADGMTRLWDLSNPTAIAVRAVLASIGNATTEGWAVSDPAGRYDASDPDHLAGLHWVRGDEVIDLGQLKSRFYTPDLLAKIWRGERLPDVGGAIGALAARPDVAVATPSSGASTVQVTLTNQGGGLGAIHLTVNGRPLDVECRPTNPQAQRETVTCPLTGAAFRPDGRNEIEVTAENAVDHVPSRARGVSLVTSPQGGAAAPSLYGLIVGTSRFSGPATMNLQFAARDATAFEAAIRIGATRLVGADHVHLTTLASDAADEPHQPTKANIARAFREIAARAQPQDTVLVYFAGHGLAYGKDMYYYLTQDATSADLSDATVRNARTVSSDELRQWLKVDVMRALKEVVILDTCAAGAAIGDLVQLGEKRELSGDQIRALSLLKDATGSFILMGSAADKVSYEASKYGQGLLTYALLQGMRGEAPLEGGQLRVAEWFGYAVNKVQELAQDIGGLQQPRLSAPSGNNFPVALLTDEDKRAIPLAQPKPQVLQPVVLDKALGDAAHLAAALRARLRDLGQPATRGSAVVTGRIVYLDNVNDGVPGAIMPRLQYEPAADGLRVTLVFLQDGKTLVTRTLVAPADAAAAAKMIADEIVNVATTARGGSPPFGT